MTGPERHSAQDEDPPSGARPRPALIVTLLLLCGLWGIVRADRVSEGVGALLHYGPHGRSGWLFEIVSWGTAAIAVIALPLFGWLADKLGFARIFAVGLAVLVAVDGMRLAQDDSLMLGVIGIFLKTIGHTGVAWVLILAAAAYLCPGRLTIALSFVWISGVAFEALLVRLPQSIAYEAPLFGFGVYLTGTQYQAYTRFGLLAIGFLVAGWLCVRERKHRVTEGSAARASTDRNSRPDRTYLWVLSGTILLIALQKAGFTIFNGLLLVGESGFIYTPDLRSYSSILPVIGLMIFAISCSRLRYQSLLLAGICICTLCVATLMVPGVSPNRAIVAALVFAVCSDATLLMAFLLIAQKLHPSAYGLSFSLVGAVFFASPMINGYLQGELGSFGAADIPSRSVPYVVFGLAAAVAILKLKGLDHRGSAKTPV